MFKKKILLFIVFFSIFTHNITKNREIVYKKRKVGFLIVYKEIDKVNIFIQDK